MGAGKSAKQSKAAAKKAKTAARKKGREQAALLRPVIVDIADPLWNNEARMVVAVTRRPMIIHDGTEEFEANLLRELEIGRAHV